MGRYHENRMGDISVSDRPWYGNSNVEGAFNNENGVVEGAADNENGEVAGITDQENGENTERTEVSPTETIVRVRTNRHLIRRIHPTHIQNINRDIYRIENFFPVTESTKCETIVKEFDCGSDLECPRCKPIKRW